MTSQIIITTAPTGLGHIRVTNALLAALPEEKAASVIGIQDEAISFTYHLISTNYYLRKILEFTQTNTLAEKIVTPLLTIMQTQKLNETARQIQEIIKINNPSRLIIVSTHAFIAQKIARIIQNNLLPIPAFHAVVVTDDSPQRFWMVESDCIFVPSINTKVRLEKLFAQDKKPVPPLIVAPYPINPKYCQKLASPVLYNKIEQLTPDNPQQARVCIPVSGAAVQLDFYKDLINSLTCPDTENEYCEFKFSVVTREGNYTRPFINYFRNNPKVTFHIGANDFQTVKLYDRLYEQLNPPSLEITKPSEQCFKVLTAPDTLGGPILLLTEPVGRQEYDNLEYLKRFNFLPDFKTQTRLNEKLCSENKITDCSDFPEAHSWRALCLPATPDQAAQFIINALTSGIFMAMQKYKGYTKTEELSPNGARVIWDTIQREV